MAEKPTVDEYQAKQSPEQAAVIAALREVVGAASPELRLVLKWGQPVWEFNGPVCYAKSFKSATNFGFWRGSELAVRSEDGELLIGDGDRMKHVKLANASEIPAEALGRLLRLAVELNRAFGDPTKGEATRAQ